MNEADEVLQELKEELGEDYQIEIIDFEKCLYRDFGNGFNIEISGVCTCEYFMIATIYLWYGKSQIVETIRCIRQDIGKRANDLYEFTKEIIRQGFDRNELYAIREKDVHSVKEWNIIKHGEQEYFSSVYDCKDVLFKLTESTLLECQNILMKDIRLFTLNTVTLCMLYGRECDYKMKYPFRRGCVKRPNYLLQKYDTGCSLARSEEDRSGNVEYLIGKLDFRYWITVALYRFGYYWRETFFNDDVQKLRKKLRFSESEEREYMKATLPPDRFKKYDECKTKMKEVEETDKLSLINLGDLDW